MHKRTAHNDTEPIEEEQEAYFEPPAGQFSCHGHIYALKCDAMINNVNGLQREINKWDNLGLFWVLKDSGVIYFVLVYRWISLI